VLKELVGDTQDFESRQAGYQAEFATLKTTYMSTFYALDAETFESPAYLCLDIELADLRTRMLQVKNLLEGNDM
jgi:hypothetical protein